MSTPHPLYHVEPEECVETHWNWPMIGGIVFSLAFWWWFLPHAWAFIRAAWRGLFA